MSDPLHRAGGPADEEWAPDDSMRLYLHEIGRVSLLSGAQEIELARAIERGDLAAKDRLVRCNLRLVASVARRLQARAVRRLSCSRARRSIQGARSPPVSLGSAASASARK